MIHKHLDVSLTLHANYQLAAQQEIKKHTVHNQKYGTTSTRGHNHTQQALGQEGYLHWQHSGLGRVSALLGDGFFTWQVEPHLPSSCCGGRVHCGAKRRRRAVGLHGEERAGTW